MCRWRFAAEIDNLSRLLLRRIYMQTSCIVDVRSRDMFTCIEHLDLKVLPFSVQALHSCTSLLHKLARTNSIVGACMSLSKSTPGRYLLIRTLLESFRGKSEGGVCCKAGHDAEVSTQGRRARVTMLTRPTTCFRWHSEKVPMSGVFPLQSLCTQSLSCCEQDRLHDLRMSLSHRPLRKPYGSQPSLCI